MGKAGYKHFTKAEKAKVKLKGSKKLLPKGLNVTDTNFKVKKIVIREQLKKYAEGELLTKKHLNIQDLISRLKHHNIGMKHEALSGLKELVTQHSNAVLGNHLSSLLNAVIKLSLDREGDIRTGGLKLLTVVLKGVTDEQLAPLFTMISSHVICAMTHIDPRIREDSLILLDVLLETMPHLTAIQAPKLLPHFLELVSDSGSSGRSLSLYLDGKITSEKWRGRVFARLKKLLSVMLEYNQKEGKKNSVKEVKWDSNQYLYLSIYERPRKESLMYCGGKVSLGSQIKEYAEILIPLLLDTFVEVVPQNAEEGNEEAHLISVAAAALLQCIVDIIQLLWDLLIQSDNDNDNELKKWFQTIYGSIISSRLLNKHFPYTSTTYGISKKITKVMLGILKSNKNIDQQCLLQNLGLCYICFQMTTPKGNVHVWKQCIIYLKECLWKNERLDNEECAILRKCLDAACKRSDTVYKECALLFDIVAGAFLKLGDLNKPITNMLFSFLSDIALDHSLGHLHSAPQFVSWLGSLPELLTKPIIARSTLNTIIHLASRNIDPFSTSLDVWIETIIDNLRSLEIIGGKSIEAKKSILSLLYWVSDWDQEMVDNLNKAVDQQYLGAELTLHLLDILKLRSENDNDGSVRKLIDDMSCWTDISRV